MKILKLAYTAFFVVIILTQKVFAQDFWVNDLRTLFTSNRAVIYAINIRSFGAADFNGNGIIETEQGEIRGSFLNAIPRLGELKEIGVNTIYLLPVTRTGKLKALGTAGSLYAMDSFDTINPQLDDVENPMNVKEEAKIFIKEAHKRGLRVFADLPSCGSYDMSLEKPALFAKDRNGKTIVPADWTDVRLFEIFDKNRNLNQELLAGYKSFIDMALELNIDGIRADVAGIKPADFWVEIIRYARAKNPEFLFLAESSPSWSNPVRGQAPYLNSQALLSIGFDGYYGEYMNFKDLKKGSDFIKQIKNERKLIKKFKTPKAAMATFATHDQQSPILDNNPAYSEMIIWLSATLPVNSYFLDGFATGDTYLYQYRNKKAPKSYTDDDYYFVHLGKMDIFNFSRRPGGDNEDIYNNLTRAANFKKWTQNILNNSEFQPLYSNNKYVFAYARTYKEDSIVVAGNLDNKNPQKVDVSVPGLNRKTSLITTIKSKKAPNIKTRRMTLELQPYEIQVYVVSREK